MFATVPLCSQMAIVFYHINYGLETVVSVLFSNTRFQIHAHAYNTMHEKFSILHEAKLSAVLKISSSLYGRQVRVFENNKNITVSNPFNIQFEFTAGGRLTLNSFYALLE